MGNDLYKEASESAGETQPADFLLVECQSESLPLLVIQYSFEQFSFFLLMIAIYTLFIYKGQSQ